MTKLRAFLRRIGSVLNIGTGSTLRERVRRSRDDRAALASDREALAHDFERVGSDLRRVLDRIAEELRDRRSGSRRRRWCWWPWIAEAGHEPRQGTARLWAFLWVC